METEKEILLNKEEIKTLENEIKNDENFISKEGHNFTRLIYEHNLLAEESKDFVRMAKISKSTFEKIVINILNNSRNDSVQILRRNIVNIRNIYENSNPNISEKGQLIKRSAKKLNLRFDSPYLSQKEAFLASSAYSLDIKNTLDYVELLDHCEFDAEVNLINEENVLHKTDCLIKGNHDPIAIDLDKNFETYKRSIVEKDKNKRKEYLIEYTKGLKEQINQMSKLKHKNNTDDSNFKLSAPILYIPNEIALRNILEIDPEIIKYSLDKNIEIFFPTTFLAVVYYISIINAPNAIYKEFKRFEKVHNLLIENKRKEIKTKKEKIDKLLKINFEYLKAPSYQVKVTLNHEENYILEEIVNTKGSNKSSVLRQILTEYNGIYKERDSLKLSVEKLNLEKKFMENKRINDLEEWTKDQKIKLQKILSEKDKSIMAMEHNRELIEQSSKRTIEALRNELMRRTEQFQSESILLKDEIQRKDDLLNKAIKSINQSLANKEQSLKKDLSKRAIQVINPKDINEFGNIMELINQNILIICDINNLKTEDKQRFIDRVYGAIYGLKGKIKEISNEKYLYIPQDYDFLDNREK